MLFTAENSGGRGMPPDSPTLNEQSRYVKMQDNASDSETPKMVAPGYPAIETIKQIDVTGWEPAAVFTPVDDSKTGPAEETARE